MSKSPELKIAEQLTNLTDDHWFNPATVARYLVDQPFYTTDRIMELVAQIITWGASRHEDELTPSGIYNSGQSSEGLFLANELSKYLFELKQTYVWENLTLPKNPQDIAKYVKREEPVQSQRYSWLQNT